MATVQPKDRCGIYGDFDDRDIVIVYAWQKVFRDGIAPHLSTPALITLKRALEKDAPCLLQGQTTSPPPLQCVQEWPVEGACSLGYCGWQGEGLETVERFANVRHTHSDLGTSPGCRWE